MSDMYYFDHDNKSHTDAKIIKVKKKFGYEGYGWWWLILEKIHEQEGILPADDIPDIAYDERIDEERFNEFIGFCISIGLLFRDDKSNTIYNKRMLADINAYKLLCGKKSNAARQRWNKRKSDEDIMPENDEDDNADEEQEQCTSNADTNNMNNQSKTYCNADVMHEQSKSNTDEVQEDKNEKCTSNADVMHKQSTSNALAGKKTKKNIINNNIIKQTTTDKTKQDKTKQDKTNADYTSPTGIAETDITFADPEDSIMLDDDAFWEEPTDTLKAKLTETGITPKRADELIQEYDEFYIISKIDLLKKQTDITNAAAWLIGAIVNDYRISDSKQSEPVSYAAAETDSDWEKFRSEHKRVFGKDFTDKRAYLNACLVQKTPSRVTKIIMLAEDVGSDSFGAFVRDNNIKSFSELIQSEELTAKLYEVYNASIQELQCELGA